MDSTKNFRISKMDVKQNLSSLFALDVKIAKAAPSLLPLETKEKFLDFLTKEHDSETWALENQYGKVVGYISLVDKPKEGAMEVLNIGIDPEFQGRGYGKELMIFAEKQAIKKGRKKITLVTNKKNSLSINFYKNIGYTIIKEIKNYYGDGETRYLFEKSVTLQI
jgi:ribosomal protein S18 acetylase RimI-like enzyme